MPIFMPKNISPWVFVGLDLSEPKMAQTFFKIICNHYNVDPERIKYRSKNQNESNVKKAICYYLAYHFNYSEHKIAREFELGIKRDCVHHHKVHYKQLMEIKYKDVMELHEKLKPLL